jgi:hypothetical protein
LVKVTLIFFAKKKVTLIGLGVIKDEGSSRTQFPTPPFSLFLLAGLFWVSGPLSLIEHTYRIQLCFALLARRSDQLSQ